MRAMSVLRFHRGIGLCTRGGLMKEEHPSDTGSLVVQGRKSHMSGMHV